MTKRKKKTRAEFKPPQRTQLTAKRQKSTKEETNLGSVDENQIPKSENNNSQNASCSDKLDEPQPGQSTLQINPTTELPAGRCCSLEEKTCSDDNEEHETNPPAVFHETEQTSAIAVQTPDPNNSKVSKPVDINLKVTNADQPDVDEQGEIANDSNQKLPDDRDSELPADESQIKKELVNEDSEPKTGEQESSDNMSQTSVDQMGIQMNEDSDPLVKRKVRKRMGMCRLGDRKKMQKGQMHEAPVIISDCSKKNSSTFPEEEGSTEVSALEKTPVLEQPDVQNKDDLHIQILGECMSSQQEITHKVDNTTLSRANADDINPERNETECMEHIADETSIMCNDVSEVTVDFVEESSDAVVIKASSEIPKEPTEALISTKPSEETLVVGSSEIKCEFDTTELYVEPIETINALPVIKEREDKCESSACTLAADENTLNYDESSMWSLSLPAALPCGEDRDVQSIADHDVLLSDAHEAHLSPAAEPAPSSPSSVQSVTDSQLNNIPLSLEDLPVPADFCDLEDATERVCSLIKDLSCLNQIVVDARRKIGPVRRRPHRRYVYGPAHSGKVESYDYEIQAKK